MKRRLKIAASFAVGIVLVWWLFRGTDWGEVSRSLRTVDVRWLLMTQVCYWFAFFTRIQRWIYIVRPAMKASYRSMMSATAIGFMANFTLPLRLGEVIRALVLARLAKSSFSKCFALVGLDRVTDLAALLVVLATTAVAFPKNVDVTLPAGLLTSSEWIVSSRQISAGSEAMIALMAVVVAGLVFVYVKAALALRVTDYCANLAAQMASFVSMKLASLIRRAGKRAANMIREFTSGLHVFRSARDMGKSLFFSFVTWAAYVGALVCFLNAFHIEMPWYGLFVIQSLVALSISVPGAPGFVGQFHLPIVVGIMMAAPGANLNAAKAVAIVAHLLNLLPILIAGVFCLMLEGIGLFEIKRAGEAVKQEIHAA